MKKNGGENVNSNDGSDDKMRELVRLARDLKSVQENMERFQRLNRRLLTGLHPQFKESGRNFLHYLALRRINLKNLQFRLADLGLSSLGRCESNVMTNMQQVAERVADSLRVRNMGRNIPNKDSTGAKSLTLQEAENILHQHTRDVFGPKPSNRHVYIMATAPLLADFSNTWARKVLKAGANLIRVNCAHETRREWREIIGSIRKTAVELELPCRILMDLSGPKIRTATSAHKKLSVGDTIRLVGDVREKKKEVLCSLPEVLKFVKVGDRVLFDDGKIESKAVGKKANKIDLKITRASSERTKLKSGKGINFPDSHIKISPVTEQDLRDLRFASVHSDIIGLSFVQSPEAIRKIRREMDKLVERAPGLVLKIETQTGFMELPRLLLEAMKDYPVGVMIARGDLGVEVGFERMVEVQEEILWLCEAAHVPVIWATQVLENQAKTGVPSRAEVTDAASAVQAECVMLNKGPFIGETIRSLDNILKRMEFHSHKKRNVYRELKVAKLS